MQAATRVNAWHRQQPCENNEALCKIADKTALVVMIWTMRLNSFRLRCCKRKRMTNSMRGEQSEEQKLSTHR